MSELPEGWTEATVEVVGSVAEQPVLTGPFGASLGKKDFQDTGVPVFTIGCLGEGEIKPSKLNYVSPKKADELAAYKLREGDMLFSRMATVGRVGFVPEHLSGAIFNYHLMRLRLNDDAVHPYYFYYYVKGAERSAEYIKEKNRGATRDGINTKLLEQLPIDLPPLAEQKRIVAKLDDLSARSARARKDLVRIDTLVKRYKQAVLSKAFGVSDGQQRTTFREYIHVANNGLSKRSSEVGSWVNVLRLTDLNNGDFAPQEPRQIRLTNSELKKYRLQMNDVVVIRVNGSSNLVGKAFSYTEMDTWAFCDHFIRIKLNEGFDPKYTSLYLNSPAVRSIIEHKFVSTSGQKTISQKTLESLPAPKLSINEQQKIVRRIESAFAKIDRLAAEAKRALALTDKLDEAILAKAFRGELVPQDPDDEPASVLLERIRAERAVAPKAKRGRRRERVDG